MNERLTQAIALHSAGRLDEALAAYRQVVQTEPGNVEACNNLGNLASRTLTMIRQYRSGAIPASAGDAAICVECKGRPVANLYRDPPGVLRSRLRAASRGNGAFTRAMSDCMIAAPGRMKLVPLWVSVRLPAKRSFTQRPPCAVDMPVMLVVPVTVNTPPPAAGSDKVDAEAMSLPRCQMPATLSGVADLAVSVPTSISDTLAAAIRLSTGPSLIHAVPAALRRYRLPSDVLWYAMNG